MDTHWVKIQDLDSRGVAAPTMSSLESVGDSPNGVAMRSSIPVGRGIDLELLLLIKERGLPLVVQFHGALDKSKYAPPRFERLATAKELNANVLFVADPTILLHENLQLAWYTGWPELDLHYLIGRIVNEFAAAVKAPRTVTTGSSGGGFAALQIAPFVNNVLAVPMNPQTAINRYRIDGVHLGPQRTYRNIVMPGLGKPDDQSFKQDVWWHPLASRLSAIEKYKISQPVSIHYWQNVNDAHHREEHYEPFIGVLRQAGTEKLKTFEYSGPNGHVQPSTSTYFDALTEALAY